MKLHFILALSVLLSAFAQGEETCDSADWQQRLEALAASENFDMPYSEERVSKLLEEPQISTGTLSYDRATGSMTKQVEEPEPTTLQVSGRKVTIVRKGKTRRMRLPKNSDLLWTLNAIAALAAGKLPDLAGSHKLECSATDTNWSMLLTPAETKSKAHASSGRRNKPELSSLHVTGIGDQLVGFTTVMDNGDETRVTRTDLAATASSIDDAED